MKAEPTPKKKKVVRKRKLSKVGKVGDLSLGRDYSSDEEQLDWIEPKAKNFASNEPPIKLPANVKYIERFEFYLL